MPGYAKPRTGDGRSDAADRDGNGSAGDEDAGGEGSGAAADRENESGDAAGGNGRGRAPGGQAGDIPEVIPAAYQGYYHDEVVELLRRATIAGGGTAITLVPLTAIDGTVAIADLIVSVPGYGTFVIEVKTGENPTFTMPQRRIYPMLQVGGHVTSWKITLDTVGLIPGEPLPPLDVYIYWARKPGLPVEVMKLPPPEFVP